MTIAQIDQKINDIVTRDKPHEALRFAKTLEDFVKQNNLKSSNEAVYNKLTHLIFRLYIFALVLVPKIVFENILTKNLKEALDITFHVDNEVYDLTERIERRLLVYPSLLLEENKKELVPFLFLNQQLVGSRNLYLSQELSNEKPTIANWLKFYSKEIGQGHHQSLQRSEFMCSNIDILALTIPEKELLRKLFLLYDWLLEPVPIDIPGLNDSNDTNPNSQNTPLSNTDSFELNLSTGTPPVSPPTPKNNVVDLSNMPATSSGTMPLNNVIDLKNIHKN
jgi:hypothetical protein